MTTDTEYADELVAAGQVAFAMGYTFDDCPHPAGSAEAEYWFSGWLGASGLNDCEKCLWTL
jgi:hypothetical protein